MSLLISSYAPVFLQSVTVTTLVAQIRVQPDTKSNPNPNLNLNPATKQHAIVNIQLNTDNVIREIHTRHVVAPSVIVTLSSS